MCLRFVNHDTGLEGQLQIDQEIDGTASGLSDEKHFRAEGRR